MSTRAIRDRSRATGNRTESAGLVAPETPDNLATLAEAAATVEAEAPTTRTRYGRVSKPPVRYEPVEQVEDDYAPEDYDTEDPDDSSEDIETESDEEDDESDADEDGNLDGFVVPDKSESSDSDSDGEPPVPVAKRRAVVKKRPASGRA
jgi:hypothetical protein